MVLRLRLARISTPTGAKRHNPFYNIVLAKDKTARDSKPMEVLGTYDPIPKLPVGAEPGAKKQKDIKIDVSRARYWLGVGAQPSSPVWRLLSMIGLLEPKYLPSGPQTLKSARFPTHVPIIQKAADSLEADTSRKRIAPFRLKLLQAEARKVAKKESEESGEAFVDTIEEFESILRSGEADAEMADALESKTEVPASTTSPMNPNAA